MVESALFIWLGAVILTLILVYRFRKALYLLFIRMIYGLYSYEYLSSYKSYYIRSPFQYCFRDDFISHLLYILTKKEDIASYKSAKDIFFENTPYFINYKDFLNKKGEPACFNAFVFDHPEFEIKALGYQETIAKSQATLVFYFMDDLFFMGEYIFKNPKNKVKESLTEHFLEQQVVSADNFYIENTKNRIIHYQNTGFTIDIKYLTKENREIINKLKEYHNLLTGKKLVMET
jgi:hypothetical protein